MSLHKARVWTAKKPRILTFHIVPCSQEEREGGIFLQHPKWVDNIVCWYLIQFKYSRSWKFINNRVVPVYTMQPNYWAGIFEQSMGARNEEEQGYCTGPPLHMLAESIPWNRFFIPWNRFLGSFKLKIRALYIVSLLNAPHSRVWKHVFLLIYNFRNRCRIYFKIKLR